MEQSGPLLITSHLQPDGDAVGSVLATVAAFEARGTHALGWLHDPCPRGYRILPGADRLWIGSAPPPGFREAFEAALVLECPSLDRTGLAAHLRALPIWNIDHHLGNAEYGTLNWVDPRAPAVAAMLERLFARVGWNIGARAAELLFVGLASDTGGFRFGNTTPEALETASRLLRLGANVERISFWLYENRPWVSFELERILLERVQLHAGGRVVTSLLTQDDLLRVGAQSGDLEGLVEKLRTISGVEAAALLREEGPGTWKVSLRSRGSIHVEAIARARGGGGHKNAAGCRVYGTSTAVRAELAQQLEQLLETSERPDA